MADTTFLPLAWLRSGRTSSNERLFSALGEVAPGLLWVVDGARRFLYVNRAWQDYTGSSLDQSNDLGWEQFHHPDDLDALEGQWHQAIEQGRKFDIEVRYRGRDGGYRWMFTRVVPL